MALTLVLGLIIMGTSVLWGMAYSVGIIDECEWRFPVKRTKAVPAAPVREEWECQVFTLRDFERRLIDAGIMNVREISNCGDLFCVNCFMTPTDFMGYSNSTERVDRDIWPVERVRLAKEREAEQKRRQKENMIEAQNRQILSVQSVITSSDSPVCDCCFDGIEVDQFLDSVKIFTDNSRCAMHVGPAPVEVKPRPDFERSEVVWSRR